MKRFGIMIALSLSVFVFGTQFASAQDTDVASHNVTIVIPEVQLIDIEYTGTSKDITLTFTAPTEAGDPINFSTTDNTLWLNYTSIVQASGVTSRRITVVIDAAYPGADLKVAAAAPTGYGTLGTSAGSALTLTTTAQDLVTGIGSCYTVNGPSNGVQLTYSVALNNTNFGNLRFDNDVTAVTYTLTDN